MIELYLIFFGIALCLFLLVIGYSMLQKRKVEKPEQHDYVDPLFAELEGHKKEASAEMQEPIIDLNIPPAVQTGEDDADGSSANITPSSSISDDVKDTLGNLTLDGSSLDGFGSHSAGSDSDKLDPSKQASPDLNLNKQSSQEQGRNEPTLAEVKPFVPKQVEPKGSLRLDANSNIITELVARVKNPQAIEQKELLVLFRKHDYKFHRKVNIYGLNQLTDLWRDIEFELPSARFIELGVSIQLADRDGAMNAKELHDFQQMALDYSNEFDAPFEFSMDIDDALNQGLLLDQVGRRYDSMAVLNVVPKNKSGFRLADIESCARDLMMSTDKNGIFVKTQGQKNNLSILYRLACTDGSGHFGISSSSGVNVHDLVIYMNVPSTQEPDRIFQDMVKDANDLATWLDGKVVDRKGVVMTQRSYSVLLQQITDIAYSMQQDGLCPGDSISKKLF